MANIAKLDARFQNGAQKYAEYLETPEGRLRTDLVFANLKELLSGAEWNAIYVLDVGCGTGKIGVLLAQLGCHVTLLDSSEAMLEIARHAADESGVSSNVIVHLCNASQLPDLFPAASFDLVLCHNVLEFVADPAAVLRAAVRSLRDRSAALSIVVRNQAGEVLKAAIQAGDLAAADRNLTAEWGFESLYGEEVRLFTTARLRTLLEAESLTPFVERGIRVVADYLPATVSRVDEYERILELEKKLGARPEFAHAARYLHSIARCTGSTA